MSTNIAFLSGKGGSGKTTLALSIADLLSRCEVKTLLIDCDLSTNGATYFYESRLSNYNATHSSSLISFDSLLNGAMYDRFDEKNLAPLEVNSFLDFVPSISSINEQQVPKSLLSLDAVNIDSLRNLIEKSGYDVVLFDCQAGYTDILNLLLPFMDVDLFVLEADSISGSAMRSLHLKIGNSLGRAKLYQVFNKATPEEFDIYSKIVGTFFTNIGTLLFDWKIRQSFSRSLIPDLENTSSNYGIELCNICKIMITEPSINNKLSTFAKKVEIYKLNELKNQTIIEARRHNTLQNQQESYKGMVFSGITLSVISITLFVLFINLGYNDNFRLGEYASVYIVIIFLLGGVSIFFFCISAVLNVFPFDNINREPERDFEKEIKEIDKKLDSLSADVKYSKEKK